MHSGDADASPDGPVVTVLHHVASGRSAEEICGDFQYLKSGDFRWRWCLAGAWFSFAGAAAALSEGGAVRPSK